MLIYRFNNVQPGPLAFRVQLPSTFVSYRTFRKEAARRNTQLQVECIQHLCLPAQRGITLNLLGILHERKLRGC